jgi:SAM-dependent methyltransferase
MNDYSSIADLYDLYVTDTRDHAFWTRRAAEAAGPILELTAGTGRATLALRAESRVPIVALDSSAAMLRHLTARLVDAAVPVRAVCGDLCALPVASGAFALAVIPFNSLGEVIEAADRRRALQELRRVLTLAGRAVVTLHNPARRRLTLDGMPRTVDSVSGDRRLTVRIEGRLIGPDLAASEQTFRLLKPSGAVIEERRITIRFALPDLDALRAMAEDVGLRVHRIFGDYDESPFVSQSSPFIVAVLEPIRP